MIETFKELQEKYNSIKSLLISLRNKDNLNLLIQETSYLPENISVSERLYCYNNKIKEIPKCPICGKPRIFHKYNTGYFATCGDKNCKSILISKSNSESKRDWTKIQEKMKATYAANHNGYTHNMQDPEFKESFFKKYAEEHNGEKCGVCSNKAKEHRELVFEERGGLRNMLESGIISRYGSLSECAKLTNIKRAKIKSENDLKIIKERLKIMGYEYVEENDKYIITIKCKRCGNYFSMSRQAINTHFRNNNYNFCSICDFKDMTFRSHFEKEIGEEIRKFYNGEIKFNNQSIFGCECDIIIPEKKLAIEANGCYWHTEQYKSPFAHIDKKKRVESKGYSLIQIWEDDWKNELKRNIILSRLRSKFKVATKIYARHCIIKEVSGKDAKDFLNNNHIQGYIPSIYKYGLYYNNELVEIITLGKSRKLISGNKNCLELYRLCTKCGYNVIGGFSKLLYYFRNNISSEKIISYADCDWCNSTNNGYEAVGFKKIKYTSPGYTYNINGIRENRLKYTKQKLVDLGNDINLTEVEIMHNYGYYRIFDSGNILFEF